MADLLNRYGFAKEAEAAYKAFIARDPKQPERVLALAQFLARQDRVAEAMEILKKAWSTCRPEQVAAAALLALRRPVGGRVQRRQVEAWVAEAVRKRPDAVLLASKLGVIWIRQGRFDEAEAIVSPAPGRQSRQRRCAQQPGLAAGPARRRAKHKEALGSDRSCDRSPGANTLLSSTRGPWCLIRAGRLDQALRELQDAKVDPRNPSLALHLAWAYQQKGGGTDQARTALREAEAFGWRPASSDPLERRFMDQLRKDLSHVSQPPGDRS